ncbi:MAG: AAA family ATPase [Gammaproteobacteria bacterium]|nr:AAA family ATPase [Gammaproteobacteria bacterium]
MEFLGRADTGVVDYRQRVIELSDTDKELMGKLSQLGVQTPPEKVPLIELAHRGPQGDVYLELERESAGTRRLLVVLSQLFDALDSGMPLVVDELDVSLHTQASLALVELFCSPRTNPNGAQLIATVHDTNLLDAPILRRDQIWFAEKSTEGATVVYPLTDIRTRKGDNLERGYLQERYGATPRHLRADTFARASEE